MNCSPTITAEDFTIIHNALCELDSVTNRLEEVLNRDLYLKLLSARNNIRKGLKDAYEQDERSFAKKSDHFDDVRDQLGLTNSQWSIYEVDNLADRHPFENADRVVYKDHWGDKPVQCSINGLTWAALYIAANACIRDSGDKHHIYIEQFEVAKDDPRTLILQTGS